MSWGADTPPAPLALLPCLALPRWPSREEGGERRGERGEGADRNISGCEPAAVCFSPLERCAASGVSLPAAGAATRENTEAKNLLSKAPDVSGHKLQSGETPHMPTKQPKLKITALIALCVISPQPCCWGVYLCEPGSLSLPASGTHQYACLRSLALKPTLIPADRPPLCAMTRSVFTARSQDVTQQPQPSPPPHELNEKLYIAPDNDLFCITGRFNAVKRKKNPKQERNFLSHALVMFNFL